MSGPATCAGGPPIPRWWTGPRVVAAPAGASDPAVTPVSERLAVILGAYTVYLDLWLCDLDGRVLANGRPDRYPDVRGRSVAGEPWFREAVRLSSGDDYVCADVCLEPGLRGAQVATYAASVREGGHANG